MNYLTRRSSRQKLAEGNEGGWNISLPACLTEAYKRTSVWRQCLQGFLGVANVQASAQASNRPDQASKQRRTRLEEQFSSSRLRGREVPNSATGDMHATG